MSTDIIPPSDITRRVQILTAVQADPDGAYTATRQSWQDRQWSALSTAGIARLVETDGSHRRWRLTPAGRQHA